MESAIVPDTRYNQKDGKAISHGRPTGLAIHFLVETRLDVTNVKFVLWKLDPVTRLPASNFSLPCVEKIIL